MDEPTFFHTLLPASQVHKTAVRRIRVALQQGLYVMLVGPLFSGKSAVLTEALAVMANLGYPTVSINLASLSVRPTLGHLYTDLIQRMRAELLGIAASPPDCLSGSNEMTPACFIEAFNRLTADVGKPFILALDSLEALPTEFIHPLLITLRLFYNEQQTQPVRGLIVLAGALDLADKAIGPSSPFNIAQPVVLGDISARDSQNLIRAEFDRFGMEPSDRAVQELNLASQGDAFLMHLLCQKAIGWLHATGSRDLNVTTVRSLVDQFCRDEAPSYKVLQVPINLVEKDRHLLTAILKILKASEVPIRDLPIDLAPLLDPLYLTGLVTRTPENKYRFRNRIYRQVLQDRFTPVYAANCYARLNCWEKAIELLSAESGSHSQTYPGPLADLIVRAISAGPGATVAGSYLFHGLRVVFNISKAALWIANDDGSIFEYYAGFGSNPAEPEPTSGSLDADLSIHQAFAQNQIIRAPAAGTDAFVRWIPLMSEESVSAVIQIEMPLDSYLVQIAGVGEDHLLAFLADAAPPLIARIDGRAANQPASNQRPYSRSRRPKDKRREKLKILSEVIKMLQRLDAERALHLILTIITAHFGLGYNRAWLFLVDSPKNCFTGRMAIGAHSLEENRRIWERIRRFPYKEYKDRIVSGADIEWSPIDAPTRNLTLLRDPDGHDLFSYAAIHPEKGGLKPSSEHNLPLEFAERFHLQDATVLPLVPAYGGQCIGLLVAANYPDNPAPATLDPELLTVYSNLAASVLTAEAQRNQEAQKTDLANSLRDLTFQLTRNSDKKVIADRILEEMSRALLFDTASIQIYDPQTESLRILACRGFSRPEEILKIEFPVCDLSFPNVSAWTRGDMLRLPDVQQAYPHFCEPQYQVEAARGWICVPLKIDLSGQDLPNRKPLGVITLENARVGAYDSDHLELAKIFANLTAVALDNADRFEQLRDLNHDLLAVHEAVEAMAEQVRCGDPHQRMELLVRLACQVTGGGCAVVYPLDTDQNPRYNAEIIAHYGLLHPENFNPTDDDFHSPDNPNYSLLVKDEQFVSDVKKLGSKALKPTSFLSREDIQAFAALRLRVGESRAILYISWREPHQFDLDEQESIRRFVHLAGVMLLNASVLDEKIQELELLEQLDMQISSTLDIYPVLQTVGEAATQVTQADHCRIFLLSDDNKRLKLIYPADEKLVIELQVADLTSVPLIFAEGMNAIHREKMISEGNTIGLIDIQSQTPNAFGDKHKRLLKALAVDATLAIRNAQRYERLFRETMKNTVLSHLAQRGALGEDFRHKVHQKLAGVDNSVNGLRIFLDRVRPQAEPASFKLAQRAVDRIEEIIRQLRRIEAIKHPKAGSPVEVDVEVTQIIAETCPAEARFEANFRGGCPGDYIDVGRDTLKAIVGNLIENAIRHLPPGGRVDVATASIGDEIVISIQDNGPGMATDDWERYLVEPLPRPRKDGHGLGGMVAIGYAIQVNGWIEKIHNGPDGVQLAVHLPLALSRSAGVAL